MKNQYKRFVYFLSLATFFNVFIYSQNSNDIKKMQAAYNQLKTSKNDGSKFEELNQNSNPIDSSNPQIIDLVPFSPDFNNDINNPNKHFGYSFFTNRDSIPFWDNLPSPPDYMLGPGDELIISLWGETQLRKSYIISKEGKIYDDKVGLLVLSGKNIESATKYLLTQFSRIYSTLSGTNPTTFFDISLGSLSSINVNFVGQLKYPGLYPIHPFSNLITGLIQVGGVDTTGTLRNISIKRNGKEFINIDLYDFFINGDLSKDIQLRDQDVVVVSPRSSYIFVDSAVVRPGIYEAKNKESIYDIIKYAGGPDYNAGNLVGIRRIKSVSNESNNNLFDGKYVDYQTTKIIPAVSGDKITVRYLLENLKKVDIIGNVKKPGSYHFYQGLKLNDILELGGGFDDSTFVKSIYLSKAEIIRRDPTVPYDKVINVNLSDYLYNPGRQEIYLNNLDKVVVHGNLNFFEKENITIEGEIKVPGSYPLTYSGESLSSIISRAGGLTEKSLENGISIFRENRYFDLKDKSLAKLTSASSSNKNEKQLEIDDKSMQEKFEDKIVVAWQNKNIAIMPGDSIVVKEKTSTIFVTGAVYNPGIQEFRSGKSLNYYIASAGGLTEIGNKNGIIVLYPNGLVKPKKWYSSPKLSDGATIIINQKEYEEPFNITQFATNWTSIVSSMITAVVLSKQL